MQVIYGCDISTENAGHYKSYMSVASLPENAEHFKVKYIINRQKIFDHLSILFVPFTKDVLLFGDDTLNNVHNFQILALVHIYFKESDTFSID